MYAIDLLSEHVDNTFVYVVALTIYSLALLLARTNCSECVRI